MNTILFFQKNCNLGNQCKYCHFTFTKDGFIGYGHNHIVDKDIEADAILKGLEQFRPYHIEFTGGEPLLNRYFKELVNNLPIGCTWAITSNTLLDVAGINFDKCIAWTASYHGFSEDKFLSNINYLKDKVPLSVSLVVRFDAVGDVCRKANELRIRHGLRINLLRELNPKVNWTDTEQLSLLRSMPTPYFNVVEDDIPLSYEFSNGYLCTGGNDYICLFSDGQVYNCYSDAMTGKSRGHIYSYEKKQGVWGCFSDCLGCAEDHKHRKGRIDAGSN